MIKVIPAVVTSNTKFVVKNSAYTFVVGDRIFADMTASAWTITLPASAVAGDSVELMTYGTYALTVGRNSHKIANVSDDGLITGGTNAHFKFTYLNSTYGWTYGDAL